MEWGGGGGGGVDGGALRNRKDSSVSVSDLEEVCEHLIFYIERQFGSCLHIINIFCLSVSPSVSVSLSVSVHLVACFTPTSFFGPMYAKI